jgi:hypothetical protein
MQRSRFRTLGFSSTAGMHHEKYPFHKALSFRINKKKGEEFWEKTPKSLY